MENKDQIKELFADRFKEYEAPVDQSVWANIESQIASQATVASTAATATSAATGTGLTTWVVGAALALGGLGTGLWYMQSDTPNTTAETSTEVITPATTNDNSTDEVLAESNEPIAETVETNSTNTPVENNENVSIATEPETTSEVTKKTNVHPTNRSATPNTTVTETVENNEVEEDETFMSTVKTPVTKPAEEIVIEEQSKVLASPMGGVAPLQVNFSSMAEVYEIKWDFGDGTTSKELNPKHTYNDPGIYFVTMIVETMNGDVIMDKAVVEVKQPNKELANEEPSKIDVGNVFTPNGDGVNDELHMVIENVQDFSISIYSVNGALVYQSDDANQKWDGMAINGQAAPEGTYYFLITGTGKDGKQYAEKGYVTILKGN